MFRFFIFITTAGLSKSQYDLIQDTMTQRNHRNLRAFCIMGAFFFTSVFFITYFSSIEALKPKILAYAASSLFCALSLGITLLTSARNHRVINWLQSAFIFAILLFGLYITLVTSPEQLTIAYLPMLMIAPHLFINKPIYSQVPIVLSAIVFLIFAPSVKPSTILPLEIVDCVAFSTVSLVAGFYSTRTKLRGLLFEKQASELNEKDQFVKYLQSISRIYVSMTYVDLENETFIQMKTNKFIDSSLQKSNVNFGAKVSMAMKETTQPEHLDGVLKFVDIKTLPQRIRGKSTITHEFLGKNFGWCRARFIAVGKISENYIPRFVIYAVENINEQKSRENTLVIKAETDAMTGLLNRQAGIEKIKHCLDNKKKGMLCLFDVDKFKSVNDNFGHQAGDDVILAVAETMRKAFRENDILLRLGGDEFIVYVSGVSTEEIGMQVISRFFEFLNKVKLEKIPDYKISISLGAAFYKGEESVSVDELYSRADSSTYQSKHIEGKSFTFWR